MKSAVALTLFLILSLLLPSFSSSEEEENKEKDKPVKPPRPIETKLYGPRIPQDVSEWTSLWGETFGKWANETYCPSGSFVLGMRLKFESYGGASDDTGMNGIEFFCSKPWTTQITRSILSAQAKLGEWRSSVFCPAFQFAVGFDLKLDKTNPGMDDNAGAVNLALLCSRDYGKKESKSGIGIPTGTGTETETGTGNTKKWTSGHVKRLEGQGVPEGEDWGEWTGEKLCGDNSALCSLQTFVQEEQGIGVGRWDDSGLVTMAASCCAFES